MDRVQTRQLSINPAPLSKEALEWTLLLFSLSFSGKWKRCRGEINSAKSIFPLETDSFLLLRKKHRKDILDLCRVNWPIVIVNGKEMVVNVEEI